MHIHHLRGWGLSPQARKCYSMHESNYFNSDQSNLKRIIRWYFYILSSDLVPKTIIMRNWWCPKKGSAVRSEPSRNLKNYFHYNPPPVTGYRPMGCIQILLLLWGHQPFLLSRFKRPWRICLDLCWPDIRRFMKGGTEVQVGHEHYPFRSMCLLLGAKLTAQVC